MGQPTDQQVEAARRQLRAILSRRDFVTAASVGVLGLAGCSSDSPTSTVTPPPPSSPGTIPSGLEPVTGTVSLPAGSTLKLTDLSVDVMTQTVPVSAASSFTVGISQTGPSLALLLDANGNGVLMSMFDPSAATHAISTHTTAVAMLYYGMSGYLFPATAMSQILTLIDGDPAVAAVDAAIAASVATDPQALANNAAPIGPAISQALQTIVGTSLKTGTSTALTTTKRGMPAAQMMALPALMTLDPLAEQNGVMVNQDTTTTSLLISNTKRRPCRVYVYQMAVDPPGIVVPASLTAGPFNLDSTEALSLFNSLKDFSTFFHGLSPWSPVNLPAIPLALATGAEQTTYQVVVLASAFKSLAGDTYEPPIFRDAHFANEIGEWRIDEKSLLADTFFGDICFPIMCFLLGAGTIQVSRSVIAGLVTAAATAYTTTYNRVLNQLQYGSVGQLKAGLAEVIRDAITSDTSSQFWKAEVQQVIGQVEAKALAAQTAAQAATRMSRASQLFLNVFAPIFAVGAILEGFDLGAVLLDFASSDVADSWAATLVLQKLILHPSPPDPINSGDRVTFSVSNPANTPTGTFQYVWTQTSPFATFSANGEVNVGNTITTSQLSVDLVTTGSDVNPIAVLVIGYDLSQNPQAEIGRAGTTVTFLPPTEIQPTGAALNPGDQRTFSVVVGGTPPPQASSYRWTLTGTSGSIGSSNVVTTTVPYVNYTANTPGNDSLHVDVLYGSTIVAKADAGITVVGPSSITFTIAGTWDPTKQPANGTYTFADFEYGRGSNGTGLDGIFFSFDIAADQTIGVLLSLLVPTGAPLTTGESFIKVMGAPSVTAGHFQLSLSQDLHNVENSPHDLRLLETGPARSTIQIGQLLDGIECGAVLVQYQQRHRRTRSSGRASRGGCSRRPRPANSGHSRGLGGSGLVRVALSNGRPYLERSSPTSGALGCSRIPIHHCPISAVIPALPGWLRRSMANSSPAVSGSAAPSATITPLKRRGWCTRRSSASPINMPQSGRAANTFSPPPPPPCVACSSITPALEMPGSATAAFAPRWSRFRRRRRATPTSSMSWPSMTSCNASLCWTPARLVWSSCEYSVDSRWRKWRRSSGSRPAR